MMQTSEILQYALVSIVLATSKRPANFPLSTFFNFFMWFVAIPSQIPLGFPELLLQEE